MTPKVSLWCLCCGSMTASSRPESAAAFAAESFRQVHVDNGCEVTDDPVVGRAWARAARRRARV